MCSKLCACLTRACSRFYKFFLDQTAMHLRKPRVKSKGTHVRNEVDLVPLDYEDDSHGVLHNLSMNWLLTFKLLI